MDKYKSKSIKNKKKIKKIALLNTKDKEHVYKCTRTHLERIDHWYIYIYFYTNLCDIFLIKLMLTFFFLCVDVFFTVVL